VSLAFPGSKQLRRRRGTVPSGQVAKKAGEALVRTLLSKKKGGAGEEAKSKDQTKTGHRLPGPPLSQSRGRIRTPRKKGAGGSALRSGKPGCRGPRLAALKELQKG